MGRYIIYIHTSTLSYTFVYSQPRNNNPLGCSIAGIPYLFLEVLQWPPNYSNQALLVGGLGVNGLVSKPLVLSTREGLNGYFGIAVMNDS
jgi:hypothetical protein